MTALTDDEIDAAVKAYHDTKNGYQWFQHGNNHRETIAACVEAVLSRRAPISPVPAEVAKVLADIERAITLPAYEHQKRAILTRTATLLTAQAQEIARLTEKLEKVRNMALVIREDTL